MPECYIGIDFGACNIKAAKYQNKKIRDIKFNKGDNSDNDIPNVIFYDKNSDGSIVHKVGRDYLFAEPENIVSHIKTKLILPNWQKFIPNLNKLLDTEEVITDIFRVLLGTMQNQWSDREATPPTTITTPVCYSEIQKQKLRRCAEKAGFVVEAVITEPFAAVFANSELLDEEDEQIVLVFDFGGSTLDLSLLKIENNDGICITELASKGIFFGGLDIDNVIYNDLLKAKYAQELAEIFVDNNELIVEQELLERISVAKEQIFAEDDDEEAVDVDIFYKSSSSGKGYTFNLTKEEIIKLFDNKGYKGKLIQLLEDLFDNLDDVEVDEVSKIEIVGGSSNISYFLAVLTEFFGKDVFDYEDFEKDENRYMFVAEGAARFLGIRNEQSDGIHVHNSIPFNLGVELKGKFRTLLNKNMPCGFESRMIPIDLVDLQNKNFILNFYQTFSDERVLKIQSSQKGESDIIFVGSVALNKEKYSLETNPFFSVKMQENGDMLVKVSESQDIGKRELEIVDIEELKVKVGDN